MSDDRNGPPTLRDLLERYESNKQNMDPPEAMMVACDQILEEMEGPE